MEPTTIEAVAVAVIAFAIVSSYVAITNFILERVLRLPKKANR